MDSARRVARLGRGRTRRLLVLISGLAIAFVVAGCGPELAGSAAVVGDSRITDDQLSSQVDEVTSALNLESSDKANQIVLDRLIRDEIFSVMADRAKVAITDGQLQQFIASTEKQVGGAAKLQQQLLQSGVPKSQIQSFARTYLLQQAIAEQIAPGKSAQEQGTMLGAAAIKLSNELDIRVSPRFGSWQPEKLSVGPIPNDLSIPAPGATPNLPQVLPQQ